jgi:stearoyl-CoA desaturase (Delta-9 desaturase)
VIPDTARDDEPFTFGKAFNLLGIVLLHVGTVIAFVRGPTVKLVTAAVALYLVRMFFVTGVYHRYFAHRTFKTSRAFQLLLAALGTTATQKGPLWWGATHRIHHKHSDTELDVHSPKQRGFFYSHIGWWLGREHESTKWGLIGDFAKYPELVVVDRFHVFGVIALMAGTWLWGGFDGFLWAFVVSTTFLLHGTFTINSLSHVFGSQRYATGDTSRNNPLLAAITLGEGWHNNHHHYQSSCRQGFYWWEIDVTYYVIRTLAAVGLVWDVREPPAKILEDGRSPRPHAAIITRPEVEERPIAAELLSPSDHELPEPPRAVIGPSPSGRGRGVRVHLPRTRSRLISRPCSRCPRWASSSTRRSRPPRSSSGDPAPGRGSSRRRPISGPWPRFPSVLPPRRRS